MPQTERSTRQHTLVAHTHPKSAVTEMYRALRTSLDFASVDTRVKSILVTSSIPGEGKTTTACNLAIVNAQAGRRTLLVDADLRRPMVHRMFEVSNLQGLTSLLIRQGSVEQVIVSTEVEHLDVLPCGPVPPNPAEIAGSQAVKTLLHSLCEAYDLVVIDSPPVLSVTDARLLAAAADGVLYVVGAGLVSRPALKKAHDSLALVGCRILGTVLNNKKLSKSEQQYYYYRYE